MYLFDTEENELMKGISFKAILLMGGTGTRLKRSQPKQFLPLGGKKVYQWALDTFLEIPFFEEIILVCNPEFLEEVRRDLNSYSEKVSLVAGGETRRESSFIGLKSCGSSTDFVVIHDAVRPFVSVDLILRNLREVIKTGACDTCIPATDTMVEGDGLTIRHVPDRQRMYQGQTPQSFRYDWVVEAHQQAIKEEDPSDDSQLLLNIGKPVSIVLGSEENHKITSAWDWKIAQWQAEQSLSFAP